MEDRRRNSRAEYRATVSWGPVRSPAFSEDYSVNLSSSGLCLVTLHPPKINEKLDIEIPWPKGDTKWARGLVKWVTPVETDIKTEYYAGIEFLEFIRSQRDFYRPKKFYDLCTRIWQTAVSVIIFVVISPLFLIMAIISRTVNGGHIFYRGKRVGKDKNIFTIYKLRTLKKNAENEIGGRLFNHQADAKLYLPLGLFLRRTKLDELPQLLNVIKGDMNLVGPRPIRPVFLKKYIREIPGYELRFDVKPGITGKAQLRGHYYTTDRNKLRYDLIYIKNRSFMLDVRIIMLTAAKVIRAWGNLAKNFFSKTSLSGDPCIGPVKSTKVVEVVEKSDVS